MASEQQMLDSITLLRLQVFQKKLELVKNDIQIRSTPPPKSNVGASNNQPSLLSNSSKTQEILEELAESNILFQRFMIQSLRNHKETIHVINNSSPIGLPGPVADILASQQQQQQQSQQQQQQLPIKRPKATLDELKELKIKPAHFSYRTRTILSPFLSAVDGSIPRRRVYLRVRKYFWTVIIAMHWCRHIRRHPLSKFNRHIKSAGL